MAKTKMKITASKVQQNNPIAGVIAVILGIMIISPLLFALSTSFLTEKQIFAKQFIPESLNTGVKRYRKEPWTVFE